MDSDGAAAPGPGRRLPGSLEWADAAARSARTQKARERVALNAAFGLASPAAAAGKGAASDGSDADAEDSDAEPRQLRSASKQKSKQPGGGSKKKKGAHRAAELWRPPAPAAQCRSRPGPRRARS
jgi:hypothetical protein